MSGAILFDIDGTLFDTEKFVRLFHARIGDIAGVDEGELIRANAAYYQEIPDPTDFNIRELTKFLSNRFGVDTALLDEVFWGRPDLYRDSLYPETIEVLESLSSSKRLGIFSQGFEEFQLRKLVAAGIDKYFSKDIIFVRRRKTTDEVISSLPKESLVVDDNPEVVNLISSYVNSVWINRRTEDKSSEVRTIHSLRELLD